VSIVTVFVCNNRCVYLGQPKFVVKIAK